MNRSAAIAPLAALVGIVLLFVALAGDARSETQLVNCGTSHDALNGDEAEMVGLVQQWRNDNVPNPGPLQVSGVLNRAAAWFAQWQVDNGVPGGHNDSLGRSWPQRIQDCGYTGFWYQGSGEAVTGIQSKGGANDSRMYIWPDDALRQMTYPGSGLRNPGTSGSPVKCIGVAVVQQEPGGRAVSWVVVLMQFDKGVDCPEAQGAAAQPSPSASASPSPSSSASPSATATATATPSPTATPPATFGVSLTLVPLQWNLVTLPAGQIENILARAAGCYDAVYQLYAGEWRRYAPGVPAYARNLSVSDGGAFWIKATSRACGTIQL